MLLCSCNAWIVACVSLGSSQLSRLGTSQLLIAADKGKAALAMHSCCPCQCKLAMAASSMPSCLFILSSMCHSRVYCVMMVVRFCFAVEYFAHLSCVYTAYGGCTEQECIPCTIEKYLFVFNMHAQHDAWFVVTTRLLLPVCAAAVCGQVVLQLARAP
jgi:hypothetical protein